MYTNTLLLTGDRPDARPLPTEDNTNTENTRKYYIHFRDGFESTNPGFHLSQTVRTR
jgi:hypothetical protein